MLQGGQDLATIGSITGQSDRTMILHYGHASQESRDRAMTVLDDFAGTQALGLRLDSVPKKLRLLRRSRKDLVPKGGIDSAPPSNLFLAKEFLLTG